MDSLCLKRFGAAAPIMDEFALTGKLRGHGRKDSSTFTVTARILCIRNVRPRGPTQHRLQMVGENLGILLPSLLIHFPLTALQMRKSVHAARLEPQQSPLLPHRSGCGLLCDLLCSHGAGLALLAVHPWG